MTKSLGQCCRIFIELNFWQHVADIASNWQHVQQAYTFVTEQFEDVELRFPVKIAGVANG